MRPFSVRMLLALSVMAATPVCVLAQTPAAAEDMHGLKVEELHPQTTQKIEQLRERPTPSPFPLGARTGRRQELEFRGAEAMTQADRDLVAANEDEIARRADLQGFHLGDDSGLDSGRGAWGYEQAVCPVFPDHVILEYSRENGAGDVSLFSAVIPRGDGHVRVIPARRRSYSLWTPSASNALTLNDFNHMVKESRDGLSPDWLTLGLCYTALTGGHVRAGLVANSAEDEHFPLAPTAMIVVSRKGGAEVRFSDTTPDTREMTWVLEFAQSGRLLKVRHGDARQLVEKPTKEQALDVGKPGN